ncbi:MAG: GMC family oxidoreductase [Myxococcales bacterium]|nr:GMC family oxidoreductase [Myxococcales bacterium]
MRLDQYLGFSTAPDYGPPPPDDVSSRVWDVCIIGSGAAGSSFAHEIVSAGHSVVMLEQGPFVDQNLSYADVVKQAEAAYVRLYSGCWGLIGFPWTSCNVGGGTVYYGAASFRYREVDFDVSEYFPHAELPVAWPYDYTELAPYYEHIETLLGIAADPSRDPTAPPWGSASYLPPIEPSRAGQLLTDGGRSLGLRPFPTPLAIATVPYRGREACDKESPCIEHQCQRRAKADAVTVLLQPMLLGGGLDLFAGLRVVRLERDTPSTVARAVAVHVATQQRYEIRARYFVVACSAIESAALLLRSADEHAPTGLGNENDMVGRGLCFKASEWVLGWYEGSQRSEPRPNHGPFSTVAFTDYYLDSAAPGGMGGLIYEASVGSRHHLSGDEASVRIECILGDTPSRENRVQLAPDRDALGVPRTVMDYTPHPRDQARLEHMIGRCEELLRASGCRNVRRSGKDYRLGGTHLHGTCRGGHDAKTSVVDPWSRVHTLDNLYVVDGAFMPYPGGANPTLTIQAHAHRAGRKLAQSRL